MHFSDEMTVGNIIILCVMIFGFGVSWTRIGSDINAIKQWIAAHTRLHELRNGELEALKIGFARHEAKQEGPK
jgi:hypothetical protein